MLTAYIMKHLFDDYRISSVPQQMSKGFMSSSKAKFLLLKLKLYKKYMLMGQICPDKEDKYTIQAIPITAK